MPKIGASIMSCFSGIYDSFNYGKVDQKNCKIICSLLGKYYVNKGFKRLKVFLKD
jgi:hypothetical protein